MTLSDKKKFFSDEDECVENAMVFKFHKKMIVYPEKDVKDFIQFSEARISNQLRIHWGWLIKRTPKEVAKFINNIIEKRAGDALIHSSSFNRLNTPEVVPTNSVGSSGTHGQESAESGDTSDGTPSERGVGFDSLGASGTHSSSELWDFVGSGSPKLKFNCTCPVGECVCKNRPKMLQNVTKCNGSDIASCTKSEDINYFPYDGHRVYCKDCNKSFYLRQFRFQEAKTVTCFYCEKRITKTTDNSDNANSEVKKNE